MTGKWRSVLVLGAMWLSLAGAAIAQSNLTIRGTVSDESGLPVAAAPVAVRSTLTGVTQRTVTGLEGAYSVAGLAPGEYWLSANAPGFAEQGRRLELRAGEPAPNADLRLQVSTLAQQITVVSSSRLEELLEESPLKVEAVTRAEMRESGSQRVSDVLADVPGVVTRRGSTATAGGEQVQGIDSREVLVLMDGLPLLGARGIKSGVLNLHRQAIGALDRVEVVKGAASALYGSDAIGGVINLIPREPASALEGSVDVSAGSLSALDGHADLGGRWKNLSFLLNLERHQQQAYALTPGSLTTVGPHFGRNDFYLRTRYAASPRAVFTITANDYHNRESGRATGDSGLSRSVANDSSQNYALTSDFLLGSATTLQVRAYRGRYDENSWTQAISNPSLIGVANLNERNYRADATIGRSLGSRQFWQAGGEWAQDLYRGANRLVGDNAGQQVTTRDVWFQDRIQLFGRATLTLGGRYQDHSTYGGYFVPKAGLVFRATRRLSLRGSFGQGFRAPDLGQLYYRFANPTSFYQVIGNPNLRPETSRSVSAGTTYTLARFSAGVSLYRNDVRDLIDSFLIGKPATAADVSALEQRYGIPPSFNPLLGRSMYIYQNLNRIYTQGFEVDGQAMLGKGFSVSGAYTFLNARDRKNRVELTQRHRHQGFITAAYTNRRWGFTTNVRGSLFSSYLLSAATGARAYPYRLWDYYGSKRVARGFTLYGAIENLLDSRDRKLFLPSPTFDRPDYGRTFRAGVRYTFGGEGR